MGALKIKDNVFHVGVQNPDLRIFDIVMETEYGTSYNAYLVKGKNLTVLIETVKEMYFDDYIKKVEEIVPLTSIDYLIVNHTEPDHSGSIELLIEKIPNLNILGSQVALDFLKDIVNKKFLSKAVENGETLELGNKTLQFISAPFLHWPDSMYTYLVEDKILFSIDSFGSHYADEKVFNDLIDYDFMDAFKYYFNMIMGPFKPYVQEALEKIKNLQIDIICPGHGPILRDNPQKYIDLYDEWSKPKEKNTKGVAKIVVPYVYAYGYTKSIAESIIEGISTVADFEIVKYDLIYDDSSNLLEDIETADALLIGSSTLNGDAPPPIWDLLVKLSPIVNSNLVASAFGAYGWSGEAVPNIESRLKSLRMQVIPGLKIKFKPSNKELEKAYIFGMDFAKAVLTKTQDPSERSWRCLVCDQVFPGEEAPDICPVCGAGKENFVEEAPADEFANHSDINVVIIGSGIAGLSAAEALRKRNNLAKITMLTEESVLPYYRPTLSDYLSEDLPDEKLFIHDKSWYEENKIVIRLNSQVDKINPNSKNLVLQNGETLAYDNLILATGARSNIPPFKGVEKTGVFSLRSLADAIRIKNALKVSKKAVVIGGGVLGLEAVTSMHELGIEVAVVEYNDRLMPRQLDESSSKRLQDILLEKGVKLYLGLATEEILGDEKVSGVKLSNGEEIPCDLIILSTGVKPNLEIAQDAGLKIDRGIVVDKKMRTSDANIYATGDSAQIGDKMIGLWSIANEMGRIAGASVAGDWLEYKEPSIYTMLILFNKEIFSVGDVNLSIKDHKVIEEYDPIKDYYKKSYYKNNVLAGEIIISTRVDTSSSLNHIGRDESGNKTKWKCTVCGYIHEGPEPPDVCPVCGAPKEMFEAVE